MTPPHNGLTDESACALTSSGAIDADGSDDIADGHESWVSPVVFP